jgi:RecA-family ATPase
MNDITPLFEIKDASVDGWLDTSPPQRRHLLRDCLPAGIVGALIGQGGTSKSTLALQLAVSIATKKTLAGQWAVDEDGGVLALFAEDDTDELKRRLHAIVDKSELNEVERKLLSNNLYIKSMVAHNNLMTSAGKNGTSSTDYCERLELVACGIDNLKLIIIDPASRFRGGSEIDNDDVTAFIAELEKLAQHTGATVLIVHHANKQSQANGSMLQQAARGASAFTDNVRWVMNLAEMTDKERKTHEVPADQQRMYIKAMVSKSNYAPPQPFPAWLKRGEHGVLNTASLANKTEKQYGDLVQRVISIVQEESAAGRQYTKTALAKTILIPRMSIAEKVAIGVVNKCLEKGLLVQRAPTVKQSGVRWIVALPV